MNRETLMLAHTYKDENIEGWFASEKLDGMRAWWDGGISRGIPCHEVPWANTLKDGRYKEVRLATGLWTRYFKPIYAPNWWLDQLPLYSCDGELYIGRGKFQDTISIVKTLIPNSQVWKKIKYYIFDIPAWSRVLMEGKINNPQLKKIITNESIDWALNRLRGKRPGVERFADVLDWLLFNFPEQENVKIHAQLILSGQVKMLDLLGEITQGGGEGIILRNPNSVWTPKRSHDLLKVKKLLDSEGMVIGYKWGKETDLGSKLLGKMGSLRVRWKNPLNIYVEFDLSGFNNDERTLLLDGSEEKALSEGKKYEGEVCNSDRVTNPSFKVGSQVTFQYRELTDMGVPKECRYLRKVIES